MTKIAEFSVHTLHTLLATRKVSAVEVAAAFYDRIESVEPAVRAFVTLRPRAEIIAECYKIDAKRLRGVALPPLAGIPIAVKDNIAVAGLPLTCGSRILDGFVSPYDATAIRGIRDSGMIMVGKTNMDEFGMGSSTENSAFFATANPHGLDYVPGGTSGGSAAAVAAFEVPAALGSDTGGSIRQPACFCGVVGLKPSYGRVSRYGLIAYASSLDQIGILSRDVLDAALLLSVTAGYDPLDSTSDLSNPEDYVHCAESGANRRFRVGIPQEYVEDGLDPSVRSCLDHCALLLGRDGCDIVSVSLPNTKYALPAYYMISSCEASSNLARYDGSKYGLRVETESTFTDMITESRSRGFGTEVKRRIMLGTFALSHGYKEAYYDRARVARAAIRQDFEEAFNKCDFLLHPVSPTLPWRLGEKIEDPLKMYLSDVLSVPASLAGIPAIVVPCGLAEKRLPIGLQITGPSFSEARLLALARRLELSLEGNRFRA